ncbi:hypothetical protein LCGC14_1020050 [marine sediment metagenome]|uniref:Uncharacterized protein n=1 Tax=marine sediment metagenome TaxID=412755 RepID=A0A0F9NJA3_9ZZZZ
MRDPKRIKRVCRLLEEVWSHFPQQRLRQMLLNFVFGSYGRDHHIYNKEDDELEKILKLFMEKFNEFKELPKQEEIEQEKLFFKRFAKELRDSLKSPTFAVDNLDFKLKDVVGKIVNEIKRIRQGKFSVSYADIVNYILGHGDLAFNLRNKLGLIRGELIGDLTDQEFRHIIEWCYKKIGENLFSSELDI